MLWGLVKQPVIVATVVSSKPWISSGSMRRELPGPGVIPETYAKVQLLPPPSVSWQMLVDMITSGGGCLDDMEANIDRLGLVVTPTLVSHIIHSCRTAVHSSSSSRRLLRFFSWCRNKSREEFGDEVFNRAIRTFAEMKDLTAMRIIISDLQKEGRKMDPETFMGVAETLVRSNRVGEAVRLFRCMEEKDNKALLGIVHALCEKGHALDARRIFWQHKDRLVAGGDAGESYRRSLLHGWCVRGNAKEARRLIDEMKLLGIRPGLASYHGFLRCICNRNLKFNPSALVPEATLVMDEMRCSAVPPTAVTFNILLSSLARARRVKEACRILVSMTPDCSPDWVTFYLVARVLYLTGRFISGHRVVDQMINQVLMPVPTSFYHGLISILCGMEKVDHALKLFQRMTTTTSYCGQSNGPTFDLLITKLCRGGRFDLGKTIWDEAVAKGIILQCSSNLLDPLKTEVFKPANKKTSDANKVVERQRMKVSSKVNRKRKVERKKGRATK